MHFPVRRLLLSLFLLSVMPVYAVGSFIVSPSVGNASIGNIEGYANSPFLRVDGGFYPKPEFSINAFIVGHSGFKSQRGDNEVTIKVNGYGVGISGKWPVHPHVQPFIRLDYLFWNTDANAFGRTLAREKGSSAGFATGVQFPIKNIFGIKAEIAGFNNVSDANIRQFSLGLTLEF